MIGSIFKLANELVEVRVNNNSVYFRSNQFGSQFAPIDSLYLPKAQIEKEFPDLIGKDNWKSEAMKRLKEHIKEIKDEDKKMDYIINELKKVGYTFIGKQKQGCRLVRANGHS